jgi:hypothetical protein
MKPILKLPPIAHIKTNSLSQSVSYSPTEMSGTYITVHEGTLNSCKCLQINLSKYIGKYILTLNSTVNIEEKSGAYLFRERRALKDVAEEVSLFFKTKTIPKLYNENGKKIHIFSELIAGHHYIIPFTKNSKANTVNNSVVCDSISPKPRGKLFLSNRKTSLKINSFYNFKRNLVGYFANMINKLINSEAMKYGITKLLTIEFKSEFLCLCNLFEGSNLNEYNNANLHYTYSLLTEGISSKCIADNVIMFGGKSKKEIIEIIKLIGIDAHESHKITFDDYIKIKLNVDNAIKNLIMNR